LTTVVDQTMPAPGDGTVSSTGTTSGVDVAGVCDLHPQLRCEREPDRAGDHRGRDVDVYDEHLDLVCGGVAGDEGLPQNR
jgi:hypothetical protein